MSEATTWMVLLGRHGVLVSVIVLLFLEWMTDGNLGYRVVVDDLGGCDVDVVGAT